MEQRKYWATTGSGLIEVEMTMEQAGLAYHSGQCDSGVLALSAHPDIAPQLAKIAPEVLRKELEEYGAWSPEELADHPQNLQRILWLLAGDIFDAEWL